jgi:hypothetical protein
VPRELGRFFSKILQILVGIFGETFFFSFAHVLLELTEDELVQDQIWMNLDLPKYLKESKCDFFFINFYFLNMLNEGSLISRVLIIS